MGDNAGVVGDNRTIFDLDEKYLVRALGRMKHRERVALFAMRTGATDVDIEKGLKYKSRGSAQKFIDETLARVFELYDQIKDERERSAPDD